MESTLDLRREHLRRGLESGLMDWVEKRAQRRQTLADGARPLMEELKLALRQAIGSYNNFYANDGHADWDTPYHTAFRVSLHPKDGDRQARTIPFEFEEILSRTVTVNGREVYEIEIHPETKRCCFRSQDGELLGPEELSERTLRPFFFPE
jgi:hypothetical protein